MELFTYKHKCENAIEYTYYVKNRLRILHGLNKAWYKNSQLKYECGYKDGKYYGRHRYWHENGQLKEEYYCRGTEQYDSKEEFEDALIANKDW